MSLSVCGVNCNDCACLETECAGGCGARGGVPFWIAHVELTVCPIYDCVKSKGMKHCGECTDIPCGIWQQQRDPSMSSEEHAAYIEKRVSALKTLVYPK